MAGGAAEIHETPLGQKDDALAVGELDLVHLRLHIVPDKVPQRADLNLRVEVADIADDGAVMHVAHMVDGDDVLVAGRGDEDVALRRGIFHGRHLVAFHRRL